MKKRIYLDYAATTPVDGSVLKDMLPYFKDEFGNPSSVHSFGQEALAAIDKAREQVAEFLNASPVEIIFTSGATESNNLTIKGVLWAYWEKFGKNAPLPHIITTAFEHSSVLEICKVLEKDGMAEVSYAPAGKDGVVRTENIKKAIKKNTVLVSVMYVNNEIGTVQPIEKIGKLIAKINEQRTVNSEQKIVFHTDAVQAVNYFDCDVRKLGVDLLSFSGHKIYGPKGVGALYIKKGALIKRVQDGGEQEHKMRAGTHNVPGIVGLGKAISMINKNPATVKKIKKLRDYLIERVLKEIHRSYLNGSKEKRSPNNANFRFDNVEGESLLLALDMEGIAVSTGSACASGSLEPSHVLLAVGLKHEQAHSSLRLTLGKNTTKKEIDLTIKKLKEIVGRFRKISGNILDEFNNSQSRN